jgi:hypothetical protein
LDEFVQISYLDQTIKRLGIFVSWWLSAHTMSLHINIFKNSKYGDEYAGILVILYSQQTKSSKSMLQKD